MENIEHLLGKVHNCDCLEFMRQLPDKCVDLVLTDIPYGEVNRESNGLRVLDKGKADIFDMDIVELTCAISRICRGSIYMFCGTEQVSQIRRELIEQDFSTRLCIWEKTNPSPMNGQYLWLSSIECCIYGKRPNATFNERCKSSVWRNVCGESKEHPTQKPFDLIHYLLSVSSNKGQIVFDSFMGSGTTAVACERLGRKWFGCELEPKYVEIANKRIEAERNQLKLF